MNVAAPLPCEAEIPAPALAKHPRFTIERSLWVALAMALLLGAANHFLLPRPLINDEAVELLMAESLPHGAFRFFTPSYPDSMSMEIESFASYLTQGLFRLGAPFFRGRDAFLVPVHLLHLAAFVAGVGLLYAAAGRLWGEGEGKPLATALFLATSAVVLTVNQFLTRNGLSILWSCLLAWLLACALSERSSAGTRRLCLLAIAPTLVMGCWTYTTFKVLAVALYVALFAAWLRVDRRPLRLLEIGVSGALFGGLLIWLVTAGQCTMLTYLERGSYAVSGARYFLENLGLTLASPFLYRESGHFIGEDIHEIMQRAVLCPLLVPFWALGLWRALASRRRFWFFIGVFWLAGMALCALGGPNTKYLYGFFPFTLLLSLEALFTVSTWLAERVRSRTAGAVVVALMLIAASYVELAHRYTVVPKSDYYGANAVAAETAQLALASSHVGRGPVLMHAGLGFDLARWNLWPASNSVRCFIAWDELLKALPGAVAEGQAKHAPVIVVTDTPIRIIEGPDWPRPKGVRFVSVKND